MKQRMILLTLTIAAAMALPAAASAHVTVQPGEAPAGGFTRIDIRVPNEDPDASTKSVRVQFPAGIYWTSYEPIDGWKVSVKTRKLGKPVEMYGESLTTETAEVEFEATGAGVKPGQFQDFGLSVSTPDKSGEVLKFPAVQTYGNGEVVRWIGAESSDKPAPTLTLTAAEGEHGHGTDSVSTAESGDSSGTDAITWAALAVAALALLVGGAAFVSSRRRD